MQPVMILELVPEQPMLPRCICQGCHDALHASTEKPFLYKFILEATRDQREHGCLLIFDVRGEKSDADVFCLRLGRNCRDLSFASWVTLWPDLRLSTPLRLLLKTLLFDYAIVTCN
ncbi:hypothetical protein PVAP13_9KG457771 [Panicum virgatum]|uniref:Uncharacterized protein n=1 Tax=Panicum virgatum TaxID=38727 RepID=A0A8T0NC61_PANVG|nr:hypothetical protein PVAP13_9KG457771 [Panicum virgatum]